MDIPGGKLRLAHVGHVNHRLAGEHGDFGQQLPLLLGAGKAPGGLPLLQVAFQPPEDLRLLQGLFIPPLAGLKAPVDAPLHQLQVGKNQLQLDGFNIPPGAHRAFHVDDIIIGEAPHHMDNGVGFPDMGEELVPQALPLAGPLHQPGDIHKLDDGGGHLLRVVHLPELFQPLIRYRHHPHVGVDGAKGVIGRLGPAPHNGVKEGAFAHVGQSHDS